MLAGFAFLWGEYPSGSPVADAISRLETEPEFAETYRDNVRDYMSGGPNEGTVVSSVSEPQVLRIEDYEAIAVEIDTSRTTDGLTEHTRTLLYVFDCAAFVCELHYYHPSSKPFAPHEWEQAERIVGSIAFHD